MSAYNPVMCISYFIFLEIDFFKGFKCSSELKSFYQLCVRVNDGQATQICNERPITFIY